MDIDVFTNQQLPRVLRLLRTTLNPEGALDAREQKFLQAYATIGGYARSVEELAPIRPGELNLDTPHRSKRLLQLAALAVLLNNPVRPASVRYLRTLAKQLRVHDPVLEVIDAVAAGRRMRARLLTMRRAFAIMIREARMAAGGRGVLRFFAALFLGRAVDHDKHWDYQSLGLLPEGTLGREYWKHLTTLRFGFPGDPKGIADSVAFHDVGHVLTSYDTSPAGEIQQGSFQGGNRRDDGFAFIQFVILHFHHGIRITPAAGPQVGLFDPEKVLLAIHRGARCRVDITHQWNFWPLMPLTLEEARQKVWADAVG